MSFHFRRGIEPRLTDSKSVVRPLHLPHELLRVVKVGIEPTRLFGQKFLRLPRLPVPPHDRRATGGIRTRDLLHGKQAF